MTHTFRSVQEFDTEQEVIALPVGKEHWPASSSVLKTQEDPPKYRLFTDDSEGVKFANQDAEANELPPVFESNPDAG